MVQNSPPQNDRATKAFLTALMAQAADDGHLVGQFLQDHDILSAGQIFLPPAVLIRLAVILRQAQWERLSITAHQRESLGSSVENWLTLLTEIERDGLLDSQLEGRSLQLLCGMVSVLRSHILWDSTDQTVHLRTEIDATVTDEMLEQLAAFLLDEARKLP